MSPIFPGQEFLRDSHGNLAYDVTAPEIRDKLQFPHCDEACQPLEIIQEAGEIIFVPSGWHHQVYNLVSTAVWMWDKLSGTFDQEVFYKSLSVKHLYGSYG